MRLIITVPVAGIYWAM